VRGAQGVEQAHVTLTRGISIKGSRRSEARSVILERLEEIGDPATAPSRQAGWTGPDELGKALALT
jgi:hypothetical protein